MKPILPDRQDLLLLPRWGSLFPVHSPRWEPADQGQDTPSSGLLHPIIYKIAFLPLTLVLLKAPTFFFFISCKHWNSRHMVSIVSFPTIPKSCHIPEIFKHTCRQPSSTPTAFTSLTPLRLRKELAIIYGCLSVIMSPSRLLTTGAPRNHQNQYAFFPIQWLPSFNKASWNLLPEFLTQ